MIPNNNQIATITKSKSCISSFNCFLSIFLVGMSFVRFFKRSFILSNPSKKGANHKQKEDLWIPTS